MSSWFDFPSDLYICIQEWLTPTEIMCFPIPTESWIREIKFPLRYPRREGDTISFCHYVTAREHVFVNSLKTVKLATNESTIMNLMGRIIPRCAALGDLSIFYPGSVFDKIPLGVVFALKSMLSCLRRIQRLNINPELLNYLPNDIEIDTLRLSFTRTYQWTPEFSSERDTPTLFLRDFFHRRQPDVKRIRRLEISVCFVD